MHERGKSDSPVVPASPSNKAGVPVAEAVEERGLPKESDQRDTSRTQSRPERAKRAGSRAPSRSKDKQVQFTALLHHVDVDRLRAAYWASNPKAASGVDGVTWEDYGQDLEENLRDLHARSIGAHTGRSVPESVHTQARSVCRER